MENLLLIRPVFCQGSYGIWECALNIRCRLATEYGTQAPGPLDALANGDHVLQVRLLQRLKACCHPLAEFIGGIHSCSNDGEDFFVAFVFDV